MKARYKQKCFCTVSDVERAVKQDVAAQIMAVCLTELHTEYGFGKKRLKRFYSGVNSLFRVMDQNGIFGREFTPIDCIQIMRDKYGIDVDKREG